MTVTLEASGTQSATVTTEHELAALEKVGEYQFVVDLVNMVANDVLELRVKSMVLTGGTVRTEFVQTFTGVQPTDALIARTGWIAHDLTDTDSIKFTLKQTFGTSRNFPWKALLKTNTADVIKWNGTAVTAPNTAGTPIVDVTRWLGTTVATPGTAGVPSVDALRWATTLIPAPTVTGVPKVDATTWNGTAVATPDTVGYPKVTIKDGTGTGEIDTTSGGVLVAALASGVITAASIAADAITAAKVADGTIDAATFAAGAINAAAIATDAITAAKIAADAIGASELATDAVTEIQTAVAAGSVASVVGAVGSVTGAVGSVTGAVGSVTGNVGGNVTGSVGSVATGGISSASFASAAITAAAIATDAIGAAELASDAATEIGTAVWATAARTLTANTNFNDPTAGTIAAAVWDLDATAHQTTGTFGQAIGDPVADTNTIYKAVVTDAAAATVGLDVVAVQADTDDIQTRLPTVLVSGRIDASVGAMAANTLTASAIATDAITAAKIAADAIGASELATDAVTEIVNAALTTAMTEAYAADGVAPTLAQAIFAIQQYLYELSISGTTGTIKKLDGSTTAATVTYSDATSPVSRTRAT